MTWETGAIQPRARVISDNDYCGDPDGLVQLAHLLLSPSVEVTAIIGSPPADFDPHSAAGVGANASVTEARTVARLAGREDIDPIAASNQPLADRSTPQPSAGVDAIIAAARRTDSVLPLFVCCGGGLTTIASAWLAAPDIASRLTLIWIGGPEHAASDRDREYNESIDPVAARVVFNDSDLDVWQVPRDAYVQVLASHAELQARMAPCGPLGAHLFDALGDVSTTWRLGETFVLGDSPLVLLTALVSSFDPAPTSSRWTDLPRPGFDDRGHYTAATTGRALRVFTQLDTRLLLEDLFAKLARHAIGAP